MSYILQRIVIWYIYLLMWMTHDSPKKCPLRNVLITLLRVVETSRALNGIAISEKRVATFSPTGFERRRRKQSRCKAKRFVRTRRRRRVREEGRARSGQTGVTGRYPLVACSKGRMRYCYCAFLHPSRTVHSAPAAGSQ